jgi:hypothetical protein
MIECNHCHGTICTVCSHSNMLMIECSRCPGTVCYCENINYCTYATRTVATLNHQHVTVRTLITVHMVPGQWLHSISPGTICTVINVLTVTC